MTVMPPSTIMPPPTCNTPKMMQTMQKSAFLGHIWLHRDLNPWPFDSKIWCVHLCPKVCQWWTYGQILSTNTQEIVVTMFVWDHACTHTRMNARTLRKHNASGHYVGGGIKNKHHW